jgi:hypothetical protein
MHDGFASRYSGLGIGNGDEHRFSENPYNGLRSKLLNEVNMFASLLAKNCLSSTLLISSSCGIIKIIQILKSGGSYESHCCK